MNLYGNNKNVINASLDIKNYIFDKYFGTKIIYNEDLNSLLKRENIVHDVYINICKFKSCEDIKYNHYNICNNYKNHHLYSYNMYIISNNTNKNNLLQNCKYTHNNYNIDLNSKEKETQLFNIFFSDYSKFKYNNK
jgi:hypothetical protein